MHVPLPSSSDYPDEANTPIPSMHRIFYSDTPIPTTLSCFAATVVMVCLYRRCIDHINSPRGGHGFWDAHYAADKTITHCQTHYLSRHIDGESATDPRSLALRMNLAAVEISLHEAALAKVREENLPAELAVEALAKIKAAAANIAHTVQRGRQLTGRKAEAFRVHDRFLAWPLSTAIQTCSCLLEQKQQQHVEVWIHRDLRVLVVAVHDLIAPEHIRPGLLDRDACAF
jgi:hypothetical protein